MRISKRNPAIRRSTRLTTADAFYQVFLALPTEERVMAARHILADDDVRRTFDLSELPNETTLKAFAEERNAMPSFRNIKALRKDLLT